MSPVFIYTFEMYREPPWRSPSVNTPRAYFWETRQGVFYRSLSRAVTGEYRETISLSSFVVYLQKAFLCPYGALIWLLVFEEF